MSAALAAEQGAGGQGVGGQGVGGQGARGQGAGAPAAGTAPPAAERQVSLRDWIAVFAGMLGAFMAVLDIQITNSSLQDIQGALGASLDEGSWISTAYLIAEIIVIPLSGWLAGIFSLRRYLIVNAALFLVFSMLCGLATSLGEMIVFRALQGFTGGVLIPTAFTIMMIKLTPSSRPVGAALFALTATFAPAIGPTLGGWLTDNWSWNYIFYINLLPGLALIAAVWYGLDREPMRLERLKRGDWLGILTMAVGLGCLEYVLEEGERNDWFGSDLIRGLAYVAAFCLLAFLVIELTRREPFINLRLLRRRSLGSAASVNFLTGLALYGSVYILPLYLSQVQGYDAEQIGEVVMWMGLPQLFILPLVPRLMRYVDPRLMVGFGLTLFAASCFMNATMSYDTAGEQLHLAQLVRALGQPFIMSPLANMATAGIEQSQAGSASGLFNIMRNLGGSFGIALLSTVLEHREHYHFSVIAERLTRNGVATQARIAELTQRLAPASGGTGNGHARALAELAQLVRRDAFVMAYGDCFFLIGAALVASLAAVIFLVRPPQGGVSAGH